MADEKERVKMSPKKCQWRGQGGGLRPDGKSLNFFIFFMIPSLRTSGEERILVTLDVEKQVESILDPVFGSSRDAPEFLSCVFPHWLAFGQLVLEIQPREDSAADSVVSERLHGENPEVILLVPPRVQYHMVALLSCEVGKSALVLSLPTKLVLDIFFFG